MLNIIFIVGIVVCLAIIIFFVVRKFPQLANLDVDNLPMEQQAQTKKAIIERRIKEKGQQMAGKMKVILNPVDKFWRITQLKFRIYVGKIERLLHHEREITKKKTEKSNIDPSEKAQQLDEIMRAAEQSLLAKNLDRAEEQFISAMKIDKKYSPAYRGLGDVYLEKGSIEEARQTYRFVLQLDPGDDNVLVKLAEIAESQGDLEEAIEYFQQAVLINDSLSTRFYRLAELLNKVGQPEVAKEAALQAVELEPKNPKFLDLLIELAIICSDKTLALKAYNELRLVNIENHKLSDFRERIDRM